MLHSICLNIVKASAVIVCAAVATSACLFPGREVGRDDRQDHREERHEERHEEHRGDHH